MNTNQTKQFTFVQSFPSAIVAMQKLGGFFKKDLDGKKYWYPERLMIASQGEIYEWTPVELTVPILPKNPKAIKARKKSNQPH